MTQVPATGKHTVQTNTTPDSRLCLQVQAITFQQLWDNYVSGSPYADPTGAYSNQCAIRMSATFHKVGVDMKSFSQKVVLPAKGKASIGRILLDGKATATRADELAAWLTKVPFCGLTSKPENITGKEWESKVKGRTGIIAFSGYWTRGNESTADASGGHIDLWNGKRLTISGPVDSIATIGRYLGMRSLFAGTDYGWSDLAGSKQILFWEIK